MGIYIHASGTYNTIRKKGKVDKWNNCTLSNMGKEKGEQGRRIATREEKQRGAF